MSVLPVEIKLCKAYPGETYTFTLNHDILI